jgi:hypothetical protein
MQNKILKSQFNEMCVSGMILDMNSVSIFSGDTGGVAVEVTPNGINLQPGLGNPLVINTYDIKGPLYKQSMPPADYLPGMLNPTARKRFDLAILKQVGDLAVGCSAYTTLAGGLQ